MSVAYAAEDGIATIRVTKPPLNTLDLETLDGVLAALARAREDADVRAVVLESGVAGAFSAGVDLKSVLAGGSATFRAMLQRLYMALYDAQHELGKPTVAAIAGVARGGGITLALSCDVLVAGRSATFGYPELNVGILPGIHFAHLPRIVGRHKAFELLFAGEPFGAAEAERLGLVNRVVEDAEVGTAARAMAQAFASKPPGAVKIAKGAFMRINDAGARREVAGLVEAMAAMIDGAETRAALEAFLARRR